MKSDPPILSSLQRGGIAVLMVASAALITQAARPIFTTAPYMLMWAAVMFSAMYGGLIAGGLSTVLAIGYVLVFSLSGDGSIQPVVMIQAAIFAALAMLITVQHEEKRRERLSADQQAVALAMMIENTQDFAMLMLDTDGRVMTWNIGAERLFGYREEEIVGKSTALLNTPEDRAENVLEAEMKAAREFEVAIHERWHVRKDDSRFFASGVLRSMRSGGALRGYVKICRDMTSQRMVEQGRVEMMAIEHEARAKAERANAMILKFITIISHEVRTPLTAIKGFAMTLLEREIEWTREQQEEYLGIILVEADRLTELADHLMDFSRLEMGVLNIRQQPISLKELHKQIEPQLVTIAHKHELIIQQPDPPPMLVVDPIRVGQVYVNLVGNAARYSPPETPITITTSLCDQMLQVNVVDQGPGIPPDKREAIFDAFVQAEIDAQKETKGAGLGLSIAKGIVEAHGGRIWIDEEYRAGTCVSFTLPIAENGAVEGAS